MYVSNKNLKLILIILSLAVIAIFAAKACTNKQEPKTPYETGKAVYRADIANKIIAITVEVDKNTQDYTEQILDVLNKNNIKATFFLTGKWVEENGDMARRIADSGHEIGNHSNTHKDMKSMSVNSIKKEIAQADEIISRIYGKQIFFFKPPYSYVNKNILKAAQKEGKTVVVQSLDSLDWKSANVDYILNIIYSNVLPGDIVCFHNDAKFCAEALDILIPKLKEQGYDFATVGEILNTENE
jgi:peptidoglycan/xylan/chitin deacetylase (PgdA/CDA1 family)